MIDRICLYEIWIAQASLPHLYIIFYCFKLLLTSFQHLHFFFHSRPLTFPITIIDCFVISQKKLIVELVKIQNDGTVKVDLTDNAPVASELLEFQSVEGKRPCVDYTVNDSSKPIPKLKIAILVVGTRGDVQPFLAMSKRLQACSSYIAS